MQYQISYLSPKGHARKISAALYHLFTHRCCVKDLAIDGEVSGDACLICFEFGGTNLDAIPFKVIELLEKLEGKTILLFATIPFEVNDGIRSRIEKTIRPFLPDECDYRGVCLCSAEPGAALLRDLQALAAQQPDNTKAEFWLKSCSNAVGHPDKDDIRSCCEFASRNLAPDNK